MKKKARVTNASQHDLGGQIVKVFWSVFINGREESTKVSLE
ncbi:hypothetical protein [Vibrio sp. J1-1]|nr:hypothetical protein [Vibrio sp. J1-1]